MDTGAIVVLVVICVVIWNFVGLCILGMSSRSGYILEVDRLNLIYIYKKHRVNWFGCFWLTLVFNLICPILSVCYWFYKLCTVGRRY